MGERIAQGGADADPLRENGGMRTIDLNADLGEGFGGYVAADDAALFALVTSANIACGFHAGDPSVMLTACRRAAKRGVRIGAHPSYPDLRGFGRRAFDIDPDELFADVLYQLSALDGMAKAVGTRVSYVKPHGALYNRVAVDPEQAAAVARAVAAFDEALPILGIPGSEIARQADAAGLGFRVEAFADRAYNSDGTLVPRGVAGAMLSDVTLIAERAVQIARGEAIGAIDGGTLVLTPDSLCVHGDTPGAVEIARAVRTALESAGVRLRGFA